jgi:ribosomal protein S18 acetylase RimI-like enzyme
MIVRRANPTDLDVVTNLFDAYRQFYRLPPDLARARRFIQDRLTRDDAVIFLVEQGDQVLGFTQLYPSLSSLSTARVWVLNDLFVVPEGRRKGVGEALLERARRHAEETGAAYLELATERGNTDAQRLYERLGWRKDDGLFHYSLSLRPTS